MNRLIFYCKHWVWDEKRAYEPWTAQQARKVDKAAKKPYEILVGSLERPSHSLIVNRKTNFIGVNFFDENLRIHLNYSFSEIEKSKLLLNDATIREFDGQSNQVTWGKTYVFWPDGKVAIRENWFFPYRVEGRNAQRDMSHHVLPWPEFGEYDELLRGDRVKWDL